MQLRKKLLATMLIPAALLGLVGVVGVTSLRQLESAAGRILSHNYASIQQCRRMDRALLAFNELEREEGDLGQLNHVRRVELAAEFEDALRLCEENVTEAGEASLLSHLRSTWTPLGHWLRADSMQQRSKLRAEIDRLADLNEQAMFRDEEETSRRAMIMVGAVTVAVVAALAALAAFSWVAANRISRPVLEVADRLHLALNPQAQENPRESTDDEIHRLRSELGALLERLAGYEALQARERVSLEGRLALVMNEVLEGLALVDRESRVLTVNAVARRILGLSSGANQRLTELGLGAEFEKLLTALTSQGPTGDLGEVRSHAGDEERIYEPRVAALQGGQEQEGWLILFWDVTEQRRFEEARRRFISMLSHQLKTPLTSLSMSVNLLREKLTDVSEPQRELLSIAAEDCGSLGRLVSDLIQAAQDVSPELTFNPRREHLPKLLLSALRPLRPQAQDKGVELVLPAPTLNVSLRVDPIKFPWVVTNITGNALRYTPAGGKIVVSVEREGDDVTISVSDSGAGIAPEDLEYIFRPHVSLGPTTAGNHGLGLAIAREIVEGHRGSITVRSEIGRGTTFQIRLPVDAGEVA